MVTFLISLKGRSLQYYSLLLGIISSLSCGFHLGWPGIFLPLLLHSSSPIQITDDEGSWLAVLYSIGGIVGVIITASLIDIFGRQKLMLLTSVPLFISCTIMVYATTLVELYIARFTAGLSYEITFCTLPLYFAEITDSKIRGLFVSVIPLMQLCGVLLINVVGIYKSAEMIALVGLAFPILILGYFWLPDSPHYYVINRKLEAARMSLQRYSGKMNVDDQIIQISETATVFQSTKGILRNLLQDKNSRCALLIILITYTVQQWCGGFPFLFYLPIIFKNSENTVASSTSTYIYYILQIIGSIISMMLIDKFGRKPLLILSIAMVSVSLCIAGIYFLIQYCFSTNLSYYSWILFSALCLFTFSYSLGLSNIPVLLYSELLPINIKAFASGFCEIYYSIHTVLATKYFQYTKDKFGLHVPFLTYAACCICSLPFIIILVSETKRKTLEAIQTNS